MAVQEADGRIKAISPVSIHPDNFNPTTNFIILLAAPLTDVQAAETTTANINVNPNTSDSDLPQPEVLSEETWPTPSSDAAIGPGQKSKRKRKTDTRVCDSALTKTAPTYPFLFQSRNFRSGFCFETPLSTRSYATTVWATILNNRFVLLAISSQGFSNAKIAMEGVDYDVRIVLLKRTKIILCTE